MDSLRSSAAPPKAEKQKQLEALRDRLAKATGPSIELDGALATLILGWRQNRNLPSCWMSPTSSALHAHPPRLTASIDAAVTLVPKTWDWAAGATTIRSWASLTGEDHRDCYDARGATPALALCLARVEYEIAKATESPADERDRRGSVIARSEP